MPGVDRSARLKKLGPRKIVEWVALSFLGPAPALSVAQSIRSDVVDRLPKVLAQA